MRARPALVVLAAVAAFLLHAAAASAAPVEYAVSLSNHYRSSLTLDGDQLTGLSLMAFVPSCTMGAQTTWAMRVGAPPTPATISGGVLHVETDATDPAYPGSSVHVVLDATVTADRRLIAGTLSFANLHTPLDDGCTPPSVNVVAIPRPVTVGPDPEHRWTFAGANLSVDAGSGRITRMKVVVPFGCAGGSVTDADVDTRAYGIGDIVADATGAFALTTRVLDAYEVVRILTITGQLSATGVTARLQIASTNVGGFLGDCVGDATVTAGASSPGGPPPTTPFVPPRTAPTTPPTGGRQVLPRSGPSAAFDWAELRVTRGASYSYFFLVDRLTCTGRATHVRIAVAGRSRRVSCRRSRAFASGPLQPGADYRLTAQALRIRRGRIVRRGPAVVTVLRMREAQAGWVPIELPGRLPTR